MQAILQQHFPFLSKEDIGLLADMGKLQAFHKKQLIIQAGQKVTQLYFIESGMVRGYLSEASGEERTLILRPTHTFFTAPGLLKGQVRSRFTFEAIQETRLISFPFADFLALSHSRLSFSRLYIEALQENMLTLLFRVELLASKSPEERYDILLDQRPYLMEKAFHKYVANYLGITPNSLSRIIKRKTGIKT